MERARERVSTRVMRSGEEIRTRLDWELNDEGACLTAVATISSIFSSGMVDSEEMV